MNLRKLCKNDWVAKGCHYSRFGVLREFAPHGFGVGESRGEGKALPPQRMQGGLGGRSPLSEIYK